MGLLMSLYYIAEFEALFFIWICLLMCCEGGHFSLFAAIHGVVWGRELGGRIFGIFFFSFGTASIVTFMV